MQKGMFSSYLQLDDDDSVADSCGLVKAVLLPPQSEDKSSFGLLMNGRTVGSSVGFVVFGCEKRALRREKWEERMRSLRFSESSNLPTECFYYLNN